MRHGIWKTTPTKLQAILLVIGLALVALAAVCATPSPPTLTAGLSPPLPPAASAETVNQVALILGLDTASVPTAPTCPPDAPAGCKVAEAQGCLACHTTDGTALIGPTWKSLFGKTESLEGGGSVTVDAAYLKESINEPDAKVVAGFLNLMPALALSQDDVEAIIVYIQSLE